MKNICLFALCLFLFKQAPSFASEDVSEADIYETSLEDLLDIQVTAGSKESESIEKTPAVVSVVTEEDIEAFGALNLGQVLERITSLYLIGTLPHPQGMLSIRGDVTTEQNSHVLVLLNGRPMRDSLYGGMNEEIYTAFPVQSIKRIEVIRGPGSVLYGTNAFVGVVNLVQKDASDETFEPSVRYGSFSTAQVNSFAAKRVGALELSGGLSWLNDSGWDFTATDWNATSATSKLVTQKQYTRSFGANFLAKYKKVTFNTYLGSETLPFMSISTSTPQWSLAGTHRALRVTSDLGYEGKISDTWKQTVNLTYNRFSSSNGINGATDEGTSNDALLEWTHFLKLTQKWNLIAGAVYEHQTGSSHILETGNATVPYYRQSNYSLYSQIGYQITDDLKLLTGAQVIKVPNNNLQLVPRAALVYSFTKQLGAKILYSHAFRAPSQSERYFILYTPAKAYNVGDASLSPETINTLDLQVYYHTRPIQLTATYFYTKQLNLINLTSSRNNAPVYANGATENMQGVEFESRYNPWGNLNLLGSLTYQTSESDRGTIDDGHIPNTMLKIGLMYVNETGMSAGLFDSFYQSPQQVKNSDGSTHIVNPPIEYYNYLSANISYELNKLLKWHWTEEIKLQLLVSNLLDEQAYYPEYVHGVINSYPGRAGRAFYGSVALKF